MSGFPPPLFDEARTACVVVVDLTLENVCRVVAAERCNLTNEQATQDDLEAALAGCAWPAGTVVSREHRLAPGDRPDFLIGGRIVVEVKGPRHRQPAVLRQLARYAAYPQVEAIVLATSRAMHMPAEIGGKPVRTINLGRAWL